MIPLSPASPEELAALLRDAAGRNQSIRLGGAFSKDNAGGPIVPADCTISTRALNRVLQYEPKDLTISVEAGMRWRDLETLLASNGQMIPLDPWHEDCTVGGVIAANISGPRRRLYGTARDMVIGMRFAMLDGKLASTGGMVVKNVAGLDFAKLLIGSFGTLAPITSVNFKLIPKPPQSRTFVWEAPSAKAAASRASELLRGQLQPAALDIHRANDHATDRVTDVAPHGEGQTRLLLQAAGSEALLARYQRDLADFQPINGEEENGTWQAIRAFPFASAATVRVSCPLSEVGAVLEALPGPALARAGNGVVYGAFDDGAEAAAWLRKSKWPGVMECGPARISPGDRWPKLTSAFGTMEKIKLTLDPKCLLNAGRLYGRI